MPNPESNKAREALDAVMPGASAMIDDFCESAARDITETMASKGDALATVIGCPREFTITILAVHVLRDALGMQMTGNAVLAARQCGYLPTALPEEGDPERERVRAAMQKAISRQMRTLRERLFDRFEENQSEAIVSAILKGSDEARENA